MYNEDEALKLYASEIGCAFSFNPRDGRINFLDRLTGERISSDAIIRSSQFQGWISEVFGIEPNRDIDKGLALQGIQSALDPDYSIFEL